MRSLFIMNKHQAVDFLKERGLEISWQSLDRHRKEGRVEAGEVKGKTGNVVDYSEEALLAYLEKELRVAVPVVAKPLQREESAKSSQALAKVPYQALQGEIQRIEIVDEPVESFAKVYREVQMFKMRSLWTIDEAVAATGVSKGALRAAVKARKIAGGLDGGKLKVSAEDAQSFARNFFKGSA